MRKRSKQLPILSADLWSQIVLNLFDKPRNVFKLLCAVRSLKLNDEWWGKFWKRHKAYNEARNYFCHRYLKLSPTRDVQCKPLLRLVYGMFCSRCGSRYHHTIYEPFRMRLCCECTRDNHVSNVVLWHEYGLALEPIAANFRHVVRFLPIQSYHCPRQILHLSRHPLDVGFKGERRMVFFWRPDLEQLYDFAELRRAHAERRTAVAFLGALLRRQFVWSRPQRYFLEQIHTNEVVRCVNPVAYARNALVGTNWSQAYHTFSKQHWTQCAEARAPSIDLQAAFQIRLPVRMLGDNEYNLRSMVWKLKLDAEGVRAKLRSFKEPLGEVAGKIFVVGEEAQ